MSLSDHIPFAMDIHLVIVCLSFALFYKRVLVMAIVKVDRGETENCLYKVDNAVQPVFQSRINYQKKDYTHTF